MRFSFLPVEVKFFDQFQCASGNLLEARALLQKLLDDYHDSTALGIPVSTTHTIAGAIVGVGSIRRRRAVRWGVAGQIVWAWVLTIPVAAAVAALVYSLISLIR